MLYNAALVLEGGAMRGQYTAGVLDTFLKNDIELSSVIGVSAGALCGANFVSKQYGRASGVNIKYRHDRDYISLTHLFKRENIINFDFIFTDHGYRWHQFDERAYRRSASDFTIVATSLADGKTVTFDKPVGRDLVKALKASCSIPFICDPQATTQGPCLDGGVADSVPYDLAFDQGYNKVVVIRTRNREYRKKPSGKLMEQITNHSFEDHPQFAKALIKRPIMYNQQIEQIDSLVDEGRMFCIAPKKPVKIGRLEHSTKKIRGLYETGLREGAAAVPALTRFLMDTAY
ncbi:patatin-like phospholipase family protein [Limosilactobacillus difficilis]|uniref:patatin-like phospholipase family protein n=1 Tax=Limosilactobacillus difficilis TaxID=2991838 RepID=UPI0024BBA0BE|nr:patatin family protein [Limosilactobacillus difficilis]